MGLSDVVETLLGTELIMLNHEEDLSLILQLLEAVAMLKLREK
jgi:hypothetical protein